jgi:hypothetical protein
MKLSCVQEPMDKAGAYGIQGIGGTLVSGISGISVINIYLVPSLNQCKNVRSIAKPGSSLEWIRIRQFSICWIQSRKCNIY